MSVALQQPMIHHGAALRVVAQAADLDHLVLPVEIRAIPALQKGAALVQIAAAGVNPSDVKAALGAMPQAVWPRTPGRDYAGTVVDGPAHLVGKSVWGTGGDLGITRDGTHARYLVIAAEHLREVPVGLSLREAGGVGVPFVTAWIGLRDAGGVRPGMVVLVLGSNGKVGQAVTQLAAMASAQVIGVERAARTGRGHAVGPITVVSADAGDVAEQVLALTGGRGADLVYNSVGSSYFETANRVLARGGTQVLIATIERTVRFDILAFYRARHRYVGVDTLALNSGDCGVVLDTLRPAFESGQLKPFAVPEANVFGLAEALSAYRAVLAGTSERIILEPCRD
ncbi:quinone oxidoreductase family protein [Paracraurococcus lichenis]|uniref:Zinc-binding alcohol dehydrogenase family protein n=1 Tax=Paracraurococcus lichenis TaxID=3064888 RepID=A0ABT9E6N9_9PROT|nr:zinc-binding alcohol dehydrogenase family protein [Paracraurococcus sp. LOR1-02]MDO9711788.1 zinc-binding alcohol dehydrogenase family protein [Paracraurococcus sp. LOR1-02]